LREARRLEKAQRAGAVAHDESRVIVSESPAFAEIAEVADQLERLQVIDHAGLCLPRELEQFAGCEGNPLSEVSGIDLQLLDNFPGFQFDASNRRLACLTCALVKKAVAKLQPLSKRRGVVRVGIDNCVARNRRL